MTTELNQMHISMIQRLKELPEMTIQPEKVVRLLIQCVDVVRECFVTKAEHGDFEVASTVRCSKLHPQ